MKLKLPLSKVTIACFILFAVTNLNAQAQELITLQKAIDYTLERNLTIKQSQYNEAITDETLKQSRYNQLPNLTVGPQASFNFGRSIDPSTNQFINQRIFGLSGFAQTQLTVFQGGQLRNQIIANRLQLDADRGSTAKVKNDLVLNVVTTYLSVLTNQDLVAASQQQIDIAKITLDRAQKNFDVGNQTLADLSQAKAQGSTADLNLTNAQNQLELSILTLKQLMEMPPSTQISVEKPDISQLRDISTVFDPEIVLKTALAVNPDISLAESRQKVAKQNINIAKGSYYPSLVLFGQAGSNYSDARLFAGGTYPFFTQLGDNFNQAVGVSLQIPIFGRFTARTNVRKAKINYENAAVTAQLARNNLGKIIYQAVWDVRAAEKKYVSTQQTYQANKDAFNVIQQRYNVGLVNSLDYNTSLTNLNTSQFNLIQARYEVVFRSKIIDYYLGNPIKL